jgi:DNA repair protein RadC
MYSDDEIVAKALEILSSRMKKQGRELSSPGAVKHFLTLRLAGEERELFVALWMSAKNSLIECETVSYGTLTQAPVFPREVMKSALKHNAAAVIFAHNHPSGVAEPSAADKRLTELLREVLGMIDVRVLDHIIVAGMNTMSFAEHGLI